MAQLDPRIATSIATPSSVSPFKTLGQLATLREQEDVNRQRGLLNEQRRRDLDDDAAMRDVLSRTHNVDDAIDELYHQGRAQAAGYLSKQVYEQRKSAADQTKEQLAANKQRIDMATQVLQTVNDQKSLDTARAAIRPLIGDDLFQYVPAEYGDGSGVKQVVGWGTTRAEFLRQQNDAIDHAFKAVDISLQAARDADQRQKNKDDAAQYWTKAASVALSNTRNQGEWDNYQRIAVGFGAPAPIIAQFGPQWSPDAVAHAKKLGMTQAETDSAANAKRNTDLREREVVVREQNAGENGAPASRPISATQRSVVDGRKDRRYDEFEKQMLEKDATGYSLADRLNADTTGLSPEDAAKVEKSRQSARDQIATRKLQIENDARGQRGELSLEEAERQYASTPGMEGKLRQVRQIYHRLTGDDTPMEKVSKLFAALQAEKDPVKIADLRRQLVAARQAVDAGAGR
jgi:hypothetical protein